MNWYREHIEGDTVRVECSAEFVTSELEDGQRVPGTHRNPPKGRIASLVLRRPKTECGDRRPPQSDLFEVVVDAAKWKTLPPLKPAFRLNVTTDLGPAVLRIETH